MAADLWKALAYLYPAASPITDYELRDDGGGAYIARWNLPAAQPTDTEIATAISAYDARQAQRQADAAALRQKVLTLAGSAVGIAVDQLTAAQVRALIACLLFEAGALDKSGIVQPLGTWL